MSDPYSEEHKAGMRRAVGELVRNTVHLLSPDTERNFDHRRAEPRTPKDPFIVGGFRKLLKDLKR